MLRDIVHLDGEFLSEQAGVELEEHGKQVLVGAEQLLPASHRLQYLLVHGWIDLLVHEQT